MEKHTTFKKELAEAHFDEIADNYEGVYMRAGYPDPEKCADFVKMYAKKMQKKEDLKIIDFACGTGLIGKYLNAHGFKNIHGIDISRNMLDIAHKKGCYTALDKLELGQKDFYNTFPPLLI